MNGVVLIGIVVMSLVNSDSLTQAGIQPSDQATVRFVFLASALYTFTPLFLGSEFGKQFPYRTVLLRHPEPRRYRMRRLQ